MLQSREERVTVALLALSVGSFAVVQSLIIPVLAVIERDFDSDQQTVTWVLTGYLLSATVCTPLLGRVGDTVGKTQVLAVALGALALGSLGAALAPGIGWLIAARVVQGAGGGVLPLAFGILRDVFRQRVTAALSVVASMTAVGFGIGIVAAGPIEDLLGVRWLLAAPVLVTGPAAWAAAAALPRSGVRTIRRPVPLLPAVLMSVSLVALMLGISEAGDHGWISPEALRLYAAAVVIGSLWVWTDSVLDDPFIDLRLMRMRGVWTANAVAACVGFGLFGWFGFVPQLAQTPSESGFGLGVSATEAGLILLPAAVASALVGLATARLIRVVGARVLIVLGTLCAGCAYLLLALLHQSEWHFYLATTVQGIGSGLVVSSLAGVVVGVVPSTHTGAASGMNANFRSVGGSLGATVTAGIVTAGAGTATEAGYAEAFLVLAAVMLVAALMAALVPDQFGRPRAGTT